MNTSKLLLLLLLLSKALLPAFCSKPINPGKNGMKTETL